MKHYYNSPPDSTCTSHKEKDSRQNKTYSFVKGTVFEQLRKTINKKSGGRFTAYLFR